MKCLKWDLTTVPVPRSILPMLPKSRDRVSARLGHSGDRGMVSVWSVANVVNVGLQWRAW